jgi:hypothetical protein
MTPTNKKVTRVTMREFTVTRGLTGRALGKPRRIVTTIDGDTFILRPHGTRQREFIGIEEVYRIAKLRRIKSEAIQKLNFRKRSKT